MSIMADQPEGNDTGMSAIVAVLLRYPVSAINLAVLILGGGWLYFTMTGSVSDLRKDQIRAQMQIDGLVTTNQKAADLAESRYQGLRDDLARMSASILQIQTDVSWLARGARPAAPGENHPP